MKQEIKIPEIAEGVTAGTVVTVTVALGDSVEADQTLLELETDKAVVAIPTPVAGTISEIRVAEGENVAVGSTIMLLETVGDGETTVAVAASEPAAEKPAKTEEVRAPDAAVMMTASEVVPSQGTQQPVVEARSEPSSLRRNNLIAPAAPSVRRLARELGVDIYRVEGTGRGGRIGAEDVHEFVRQSMQRMSGGGMVAAKFSGPDAQRPLPDYSRFGEISREPLSRVRQLTADAMSHAWSTIPMVTQYDRACIGKVEEFRKEFNLTATSETKLTMTAFMIKVCAAALRVFPHFNSALDLARRELVLNHFINIGVAVDTPAGLLVPVIRAADNKGVERIAVELNELAIRSRERRIGPTEMEGGTFTISNLGGIGGNAFTPIVYPPQVAILGIAEAQRQPVWNGSEFEPQLMMPLCLSYDHRVIDGAAGARFLRWICQALENPLQLVMKG